MKNIQAYSLAETKKGISVIPSSPVIVPYFDSGNHWRQCVAWCRSRKFIVSSVFSVVFSMTIRLFFPALCTFLHFMSNDTRQRPMKWIVRTGTTCDWIWTSKLCDILLCNSEQCTSTRAQKVNWASLMKQHLILFSGYFSRSGRNSQLLDEYQCRVEIDSSRWMTSYIFVVIKRYGNLRRDQGNFQGNLGTQQHYPSACPLYHHFSLLCHCKHFGAITASRNTRFMVQLACYEDNEKIFIFVHLFDPNYWNASWNNIALACVLFLT